MSRGQDPTQEGRERIVSEAERQKETSRSRRSQDRPLSTPPWPTATASLLLLLWLLWLFLQTGHPFDEGEHLHAAWMTGEGLVPGVDFFEHHTPVLWWLLVPWFFAGGAGPPGLWAGRGLVVITALASHRLLGKIRDKSTPGADLQGESSGAVGVAETTLVFATLAAPGLLVIRPETPGLGLFLGGALLWLVSEGSRSRSGVSGLFLSLSVFASPRLLIACLGLALFEWMRRRTRSPSEYLALLTGGCAAIAVPMTLLPGASWGYLRFTIEFSSLLQRVAEGGGAPVAVLGVLVGLPLLFLGIVGSRLSSRRLQMAGALSWLLVAGLSWGLAGRHVYSQDFAALLAWSLVLLAVWEGRDGGSARLPIRGLAMAGAAVYLVCRLALLLGSGGTIASSVEVRREMLELARARGRPVLMTPTFHPISWPDADFYWLGDRLCRAIRIYEERTGEEWPRCDPARTALTGRPAIVEREILVETPGGRDALESLLESGYRPRHEVLVAPESPAARHDPN